MTVGSLFAGIGGFELAAMWAGFTPVWSNEIDPFCCQVLRKNFKHRIIEADIRNIGGGGITLESVDIITGGDPCQPHSTSGVRKGKDDLRYLWPEYLRIITALRPKVCFNENVSGSVSNGVLDQKISDLEAEGYTVWPPMLIPAGAAGALHRRDRIWLVAHSDENGLQGVSQQLESCYAKKERSEERPDSTGTHRWSYVPRGQREQLFTTEPPLVRGDNGIPKELDAIGAIGNAIDTRVAFQIFNAIKKTQWLNAQ